MAPEFDERITRILERRDRRQAEAHAGESEAARHRREAREHLLAEIPKAAGRLSAAIAELNDRITESGLLLKLAPVESSFTVEVSLRVSLAPDDDGNRSLVFTVSHEGRVHALLSFGQERSLLKSAPIEQADRTFFIDALVSFLEASV